MRLRRQRPQRHAGGIETRQNGLDRLHVIQRNRLGRRPQPQQVPQGGDRPLVHQLGEGPVIGVVAAGHRLLQGLHHVRVVGVVFAAVHVLEQATGLDRQSAFPGSPRQLGLIRFQIAEARALNAAGGILEAQLHHLVAQADDFEQLRAAIAVDGGDPHLGDDLVQALADALAVVLHQGRIIAVDDLAAAQ